MAGLGYWDIRNKLNQALADLVRIEGKIDKLLALITGAGVPDDIDIKLKGAKTMLKVKCQVKGFGPKAVMPPVNLTDIITAGGLIIQFVDPSGNPVIVDPTTVVGAMTVSDPTVTVTQGADTLHWNITVPAPLASSGTTITDSATATFNAGTPGPFNASLPIVCNVTPPPPVPVDIQIILA